MGTTTSKTNKAQVSQSDLLKPQPQPHAFGTIRCPTISFPESEISLGAFGKLPKDLFFEFAKELSDKDLLSLLATCKSTYRLLSQNSFWLRTIKNRDTKFFDEEISQELFSKVMYWYFYNKNKTSIKLINEKTTPFNYLTKAIIIGKDQVGKTGILAALVGDPFNDLYISTIGVDFKAPLWSYNNKLYKVQIWDTAGQDRFRSVTQAYYRGSSHTMLVYSVTSRDSFVTLPDFYKDALRHHVPQSLSMIVIANCVDIPETEWKVTREEGRAFAAACHAPFVEVSAKTGKGLARLTRCLLDAVTQNQEREVRYD